MCTLSSKLLFLDFERFYRNKKFKMLSSILVSSSFFTPFSHASYTPFDPSAPHVPTLGSNSVYEVSKFGFFSVTEDDYRSNPASKFAFYKADADGTLSKTYWSYNTSITGANSIIKAGKISSPTYSNYQTNLPIEVHGSFFGLTAFFGGGVENRGVLKNIRGEFINNLLIGSDSKGGGVYNSGTIGDIEGDFIRNNAKVFGGAIYNTSQGKIASINGNFIGNFLDGSSPAGGAIANNGTIGDIAGNFIGNSTAGDYSYGGAIDNDLGTIGSINGNFIGNISHRGGAIFNSGTIIKIINSSFIDNYAKSIKVSFPSQGGAIWSNTNLLIESDNGLSEFTGNYIENNGAKGSNAIFMAKPLNAPIAPALSLNAINGGTIIFNDAINGDLGYKVKVSGDKNSSVIFNNEIKNAILSVEEVQAPLVQPRCVRLPASLQQR